MEESAAANTLAENPNCTRPGNPLSLTTGVLKRLHQSPPATYKECLKNHAASIGGHAVDGCGEFMPCPGSLKCAGETEPGLLTCAACGCHRNFHRREPDESHVGVVSGEQHVIEFQPVHRHHPLPPPYSGSSPESQSPPPISSSHMLLALRTGMSTQRHKPHSPNPNLSDPTRFRNPNSRKRFRTKFTRDQKEKMQEFADKIEWKIQRSDDGIIREFCSEIGVEKGVLKVWMHNNKSSLGKKDGSININGGELNRVLDVIGLSSSS